jgi:signal transduction histidine kinase
MKLRQRLRGRQALPAPRSTAPEAVRAQARQLTELAQHLQSAREDERARLARDLHDELGALLTAAQLDAARLRARLLAFTPPAAEALACLDSLVASLDGVITLKRSITEDLRPSSLSHLGLAVTLQTLAREFGLRSGLQVHLALAEAGVPLTPAAELAAYRVAQEALSNIARHAHAQQLWLTLRRQGARVLLTVRDDGRGFVPAAVPARRHGLLGMRFRAEAEGGRLTLQAAPGQGTRLTLSLPVAAMATQAGQAEDTGD